MAHPPDLIDDAATEILLRLPPDDPACLVRASLVCKAWRELLSSPAFLRRYRAFHGAPPLLGVIYNEAGPCARFVAADPRASPLSAPAFGCRNHWWVHECRHGRVLVQSFERTAPNFFVWDPITGDRQQVPVPTSPYHQTAAVLCGVDGCDHLNCHGGPFLVVIICVHDDDEEGELMSACLYSSETGTSIRSPTVQLAAYIQEGPKPSLLARDALYFTVQLGRRILKYDLAGQALQVIAAPDMFDEVDGIAVTAEDGGLGLTGIMDGKLHLWSWQAGPYGVAEWVQSRVVKLSTLLPKIAPLTSLGVIGFKEGTDTIFISTEVGVFAIMLKSEQMKKVGVFEIMLTSEQMKKLGERGSNRTIVPYMRFYTPDLTTGRLPPP